MITDIKSHQGVFLDMSSKGQPYISFINPTFIKRLSADELSYVQPRALAMKKDIMMDSTIKTIIERSLPFVTKDDNTMLVKALEREIVDRTGSQDIRTYLNRLIEVHFK